MSQATEEFDEFFRKFVQDHHWTVAKTMPWAPHEYTLRRNCTGPQDESDFERVVLGIRSLGYEEKYGKSTYIRYDLDGWKYWTMGAPLDQTILINRARVNDAAKRLLAPEPAQRTLS